jgi:Flp pilus assembly protein TadG
MNRLTKLQSAQGMVEFALVLPILMLVIMGIFAFGHFFFTYSSIVSASREAARWGAAVGASTNGYPRYKDCDAIRDAAVRVGSFAGVSRSSVAITYDTGPQDTMSPKPVCPTADGSQGPDVALGNRINVDVTVQYTPIVPLVQMPSFPITATTSRTILLNLPVGEVPTASSIYPTTTLNVTINDAAVVLENPGSSSVVGQVFPITVTVTSSDNTIPTGNLYIADDSVPQQSCGTLHLDGTGSASCNVFVYNAVTTDTNGVNKPHVIGIVYDPVDAPYNTSNVNVNHTVAQATSTTTITSITPADQAYPGQTVTVKAHVAPQYSGVPTGTAQLRLGDQTVVATGTLDGSGNVTLSFTPAWTGTRTLAVYYAGDANFTPSNTAETITNYLVQSLAVDVHPQTTTGTTGVPSTIQVQVVSHTGNGGIPAGTVTIFETANNSHTCTATLNAMGVGACALTFPTAGSYGMTASFTSGNVTFQNGSATFTLEINNKTTTSITLSPDSQTIGSGGSATFTVHVSPNVPGTVSVLGSNGSSCTPTLNNGQGSCTVTDLKEGDYTSEGKYTFRSTFTPDDSNTYAPSLSNSVVVVSKCPTHTVMQPDPSHPNSIQFNVSNTSPYSVNLNVTSVTVSWAINPTNYLKDIVFIGADQLSGTCSDQGNNKICLWAYKKANNNDPNVGIGPSIPLPSNNFPSWDSKIADIGAGATKIFRLDFINSINAGNSVVIEFDQGCTLKASQP